MLPLERRRLILERIHREGKVQIEQLSKELDVSQMTVRRDLDRLESEGKLVRTHGGAITAQPLTSETPCLNKVSRYTPQKRAIAQVATQMVPKGATILLDSGTTTLEIARTLVWRDDLKIVTNDITIAHELLESKSHVILTGGDMQRRIGALTGPHAQHLLGHIRVDLLFLGVHAIHLKAGITAPDLDKALIKRMMVEAATEAWVVSDSSKFGQRSFAHVCSLSRIDGIITDGDWSEEDRASFEKEVNIQYASEMKG